MEVIFFTFGCPSLGIHLLQNGRKEAQRHYIGCYTWCFVWCFRCSRLCYCGLQKGINRKVQSLIPGILTKRSLTVSLSPVPDRSLDMLFRVYVGVVINLQQSESMGLQLQLVEHLICTQVVESSNLFGSTNKLFEIMCYEQCLLVKVYIVQFLVQGSIKY